MRTAIYVRYSDPNQRAASLEDQERLCRAEAARLGYTVARVYSDAELSGQLDDQRPGFAALLEAARQRAFDVLIVDDASRLSRNSADAMRLLQRLEFWGIGLVARADGINTVTNKKGTRLLYGIKSAMNDEFLRNLGENVWRGQDGRARRGFNTGGLAYGHRSTPVSDATGRVIGYRRVIYEPEAVIVRRIFQMYADGCSIRAIVRQLNDEGIAPPGARWRNRTTRQAATWSPSALIAHRRLQKGVLLNPLYIGRAVWNRSKWQRDPDSKAYRYRIRPVAEHVQVALPELRIIPEDLWERVQTRLELRVRAVPAVPGRRNLGKYLLSGFVFCAECAGTYSKINHSYQCSNHRNRGDRACTNTRGVTVERLERTVLQALRERLYTPANMRVIVERVRDALLTKARQTAKTPAEQLDQLRAVEREIENIKAAVRLGKATDTLLTILEEVEKRRAALQDGYDTRSPQDVQARLESVLVDLPDKVQAYLDDLETLLARHEIERGKDLLASLGTKVLIAKDGVIEIQGDLRRATKAVLSAAGSKRESVVLWLGEEDSNPR